MTGPLQEGTSGSFLVLPCFIEIPVFKANNVDPDQIPRSTASDLGLHRLSMSILWDSMHKWINWHENFAQEVTVNQKLCKTKNLILSETYVLDMC